MSLDQLSSQQTRLIMFMSDFVYNLSTRDDGDTKDKVQDALKALVDEPHDRSVSIEESLNILGIRLKAINPETKTNFGLFYHVALLLVDIVLKKIGVSLRGLLGEDKDPQALAALSHLDDWYINLKDDEKQTVKPMLGDTIEALIENLEFKGCFAEQLTSVADSMRVLQPVDKTITEPMSLTTLPTDSDPALHKAALGRKEETLSSFAFMNTADPISGASQLFDGLDVQTRPATKPVQPADSLFDSLTVVGPGQNTTTQPAKLGSSSAKCKRPRTVGAGREAWFATHADSQPLPAEGSRNGHSDAQPDEAEPVHKEAPYTPPADGLAQSKDDSSTDEIDDSAHTDGGPLQDYPYAYPEEKEEKEKKEDKVEITDEMHIRAAIHNRNELDRLLAVINADTPSPTKNITLTYIERMFGDFEQYPLIAVEHFIQPPKGTGILALIKSHQNTLSREQYQRLCTSLKTALEKVKASDDSINQTCDELRKKIDASISDQAVNSTKLTTRKGWSGVMPSVVKGVARFMTFTDATKAGRAADTAGDLIYPPPPIESNHSSHSGTPNGDLNTSADQGTDGDDSNLWLTRFPSNDDDGHLKHNNHYDARTDLDGPVPGVPAGSDPDRTGQSASHDDADDEDELDLREAPSTAEHRPKQSELPDGDGTPSQSSSEQPDLLDKDVASSQSSSKEPDLLSTDGSTDTDQTIQTIDRQLDTFALNNITAQLEAIATAMSNNDRASFDNAIQQLVDLNGASLASLRLTDSKDHLNPQGLILRRIVSSVLTKTNGTDYVGSLLKLLAFLNQPSQQKLITLETIKLVADMVILQTLTIQLQDKKRQANLRLDEFLEFYLSAHGIDDDKPLTSDQQQCLLSLLIMSVRPINIPVAVSSSHLLATLPFDSNWQRGHIFITKLMLALDDDNTRSLLDSIRDKKGNEYLKDFLQISSFPKDNRWYRHYCNPVSDDEIETLRGEIESLLTLIIEQQRSEEGYQESQNNINRLCDMIKKIAIQQLSPAQIILLLEPQPTLTGLPSFCLIGKIDALAENQLIDSTTFHAIKLQLFALARQVLSSYSAESEIANDIKASIAIAFFGVVRKEIKRILDSSGYSEAVDDILSCFDSKQVADILCGPSIDSSLIPLIFSLRRTAFKQGDSSALDSLNKTIRQLYTNEYIARKIQQSALLGRDMLYLFIQDKGNIDDFRSLISSYNSHHGDDKLRRIMFYADGDYGYIVDWLLQAQPTDLRKYFACYLEYCDTAAQSSQVEFLGDRQYPFASYSRSVLQDKLATLARPVSNQKKMFLKQAAQLKDEDANLTFYRDRFKKYMLSQARVQTLEPLKRRLLVRLIGLYLTGPIIKVYIKINPILTEDQSDRIIEKADSFLTTILASGEVLDTYLSLRVDYHPELASLCLDEAIEDGVIDALFADKRQAEVTRHYEMLKEQAPEVEGHSTESYDILIKFTIGDQKKILADVARIRDLLSQYHGQLNPITVFQFKKILNHPIHQPKIDVLAAGYPTLTWLEIYNAFCQVNRYAIAQQQDHFDSDVPLGDRYCAISGISLTDQTADDVFRNVIAEIQVCHSNLSSPGPEKRDIAEHQRRTFLSDTHEIVDVAVGAPVFSPVGNIFYKVVQAFDTKSQNDVVNLLWLNFKKSIHHRCFPSDGGRVELSSIEQVSLENNLSLFLGIYPDSHHHVIPLLLTKGFSWVISDILLLVEELIKAEYLDESFRQIVFEVSDQLNIDALLKVVDLAPETWHPVIAQALEKGCSYANFYDVINHLDAQSDTSLKRINRLRQSFKEIILRTLSSGHTEIPSPEIDGGELLLGRHEPVSSGYDRLITAARRLVDLAQMVSFYRGSVHEDTVVSEYNKCFDLVSGSLKFYVQQASLQELNDSLPIIMALLGINTVAVADTRELPPLMSELYALLYDLMMENDECACCCLCYNARAFSLTYGKLIRRSIGEIVNDLFYLNREKLLRNSAESQSPLIRRHGAEIVNGLIRVSPLPQILLFPLKVPSLALQLVTALPRFIAAEHRNRKQHHQIQTAERLFRTDLGVIELFVSFLETLPIEQNITVTQWLLQLLKPLLMSGSQNPLDHAAQRQLVSILRHAIHRFITDGLRQGSLSETVGVEIINFLLEFLGSNSVITPIERAQFLFGWSHLGVNVDGLLQVLRPHIGWIFGLNRNFYRQMITDVFTYLPLSSRLCKTHTHTLVLFCSEYLYFSLESMKRRPADNDDKFLAENASKIIESHLRHSENYGIVLDQAWQNIAQVLSSTDCLKVVFVNHLYRTAQDGSEILSPNLLTTVFYRFPTVFYALVTQIRSDAPYDRLADAMTHQPTYYTVNPDVTQLGPQSADLHYTNMTVIGWLARQILFFGDRKSTTNQNSLSILWRFVESILKAPEPHFVRQMIEAGGSLTLDRVKYELRHILPIPSPAPDLRLQILQQKLNQQGVVTAERKSEVLWKIITETWKGNTPTFLMILVLSDQSELFSTVIDSINHYLKAAPLVLPSTNQSVVARRDTRDNRIIQLLAQTADLTHWYPQSDGSTTLIGMLSYLQGDHKRAVAREIAKLICSMESKNIINLLQYKVDGEETDVLGLLLSADVRESVLKILTNVESHYFPELSSRLASLDSLHSRSTSSLLLRFFEGITITCYADTAIAPVLIALCRASHLITTRYQRRDKVVSLLTQWQTALADDAKSLSFKLIMLAKSLCQSKCFDIVMVEKLLTFVNDRQANFEQPQDIASLLTLLKPLSATQRKLFLNQIARLEGISITVKAYISLLLTMCDNLANQKVHEALSLAAHLPLHEAGDDSLEFGYAQWETPAGQLSIVQFRAMVSRVIEFTDLVTQRLLRSCLTILDDLSFGGITDRVSPSTRHLDITALESQRVIDTQFSVDVNDPRLVNLLAIIKPIYSGQRFSQHFIDLVVSFGCVFDSQAKVLKLLQISQCLPLMTQIALYDQLLSHADYQVSEQGRQLLLTARRLCEVCIGRISTADRVRHTASQVAANLTKLYRSLRPLQTHSKLIDKLIPIMIFEGPVSTETWQTLKSHVPTSHEKALVELARILTVLPCQQFAVLLMIDVAAGQVNATTIWHLLNAVESLPSETKQTFYDELLEHPWTKNHLATLLPMRHALVSYYDWFQDPQSINNLVVLLTRAQHLHPVERRSLLNDIKTVLDRQCTADFRGYMLVDLALIFVDLPSQQNLIEAFNTLTQHQGHISAEALKALLLPALELSSANIEQFIAIIEQYYDKQHPELNALISLIGFITKQQDDFKQLSTELLMEGYGKKWSLTRMSQCVTRLVKHCFKGRLTQSEADKIARTYSGILKLTKEQPNGPLAIKQAIENAIGLSPELIATAAVLISTTALTECQFESPTFENQTLLLLSRVKSYQHRCHWFNGLMNLPQLPSRLKRMVRVLQLVDSDGLEPSHLAGLIKVMSDSSDYFELVSVPLVIESIGRWPFVQREYALTCLQQVEPCFASELLTHRKACDGLDLSDKQAIAVIERVLALDVNERNAFVKSATQAKITADNFGVGRAYCDLTAYQQSILRTNLNAILAKEAYARHTIVAGHEVSLVQHALKLLISLGKIKLANKLNSYHVCTRQQDKRALVDDLIRQIQDKIPAKLPVNLCLCYCTLFNIPPQFMPSGLMLRFHSASNKITTDFYALLEVLRALLPLASSPAILRHELKPYIGHQQPIPPVDAATNDYLRHDNTHDQALGYTNLEDGRSLLQPTTRRQRICPSFTALFPRQKGARAEAKKKPETQNPLIEFSEQSASRDGGAVNGRGYYPLNQAMV